MLKRKWYEIPLMYEKRTQDWLSLLTYVMARSEELEVLVKATSEYYWKYEVPVIYPYTEERMSFDLPHFGYGCKLETMAGQLNAYMQYYQLNGRIYTEMMQKKKEILGKARSAFIKKAIEEANKDTNVIVIKSGYQPIYKEEIERFELACRELADKPGLSTPSIYSFLYTEWFAFCPKYYNSINSINSLSKSWVGLPKESTVEYM